MLLIRQTLSTRLLRPIVPGLLVPIVLAQTACGQPANEPLERFVVTDGFVTTMATNNNILYFGGQFAQVGLRTGSGVPVSIVSGQAEPVFPSVNGDVYAAINDGQGGWFVGGFFSVVGGFLRTNLVHIKSDRTVDQNWAPSAAGGSVHCLALSAGTLY